MMATPATASVSVPALKKSFDALQSWITRHGGVASDVVCERERGMGFGVKCLKDKREGEVVLYVPRRLHMDVNATYRHDMEWLLKGIQLPETVDGSVPPDLFMLQLGLVVLAERIKGNSFFQPYIDVLPASFVGLPLFFNSACLAALEETGQRAHVGSVSKSLMQLAKKISHRYVTTKRMFFESDAAGANGGGVGGGGEVEVDANLLGWALAISYTRSIWLPRSFPDSKQFIDALVFPARLVPLVDMINHEFFFDANCRLEWDAEGSVLVVANRDISAGEFLRYDYGRFARSQELPSSFYLTWYGFVPEGGPHDFLPFSFDKRLIQAGRDTFAPTASGGEDGALEISEWRADLLERLRLLGTDSDRLMKIKAGGYPAACRPLWTAASWPQCAFSLPGPSTS
ncbi:unnamed protein product [Vitrella brassicaformis CCMP3155]|uniref:SET domain-containing protein n=1 Tax=Vitrella brassicaformis (strain CCMP3155) TaxID=1169540 RepID=A0A0G4GL51_VITBC|nr:unnamed protein product [Vitrella brassicaformis CCMP3155]|eukprot:CEM30725.1 unnamed protein product [Vitrella brassicaformis CCMP3155]